MGSEPAKTTSKRERKKSPPPANGDRPANRRRGHETTASHAGALATPLFTLGAPPQAQAVIGQPDDLYEQEADAAAAHISAGRPAPSLSPIRPGRVNGAAQRKIDEQSDPEPAAEEEPALKTPIQRQAERDEATAIMATTANQATQSRAAGSPLAPAMRETLEAGLGADLSGVRVHRDGAAHEAADHLQARAFAYQNHIWLGAGESAGDVKLMAHEAAHVVQQRAAGADAALVQRLPRFITSRLAEYARHIPGYTLFTVIIGYNPLAGARVERTAMNLVEGLLALVPFGTVIFDKLRELGILQEAFAWVQGQLSRFDLSLGRLERLINEAWDEMDFIRLDPFAYNLAILRRKFGALWEDVKGFAGSLVGKIVEMIKEAAIGVAESLLAENRAWDLIKKILKYDPLRGEPVEATTVEILRDFLLLIGKEQELEQMQARGTLQETADWLDTQLAIFLGLLGQLRGLFAAAWDAIQPQNLPNLMSNLRDLAGQAASFLQQVWDFASTVALQVLELIKNALLGWLSDFAHELPGFHLITVIIGRNPFTQETVPRTAENIIRGFITLLPGGGAQYQQMAETGVIGQAAARIEGAMAELGISWEFIVGLFVGIWESLTIADLIDPIGAFQRIRDQFGEPVGRLFAFVRIVIEEIFKLILELMNFPSELLGSIISNAMQAFDAIRSDPVGFLLNMLAAVKLGFSNFFDNILQHLIGGLVDWLFRGLRDAGIQPPSDLSPASILDLVMQILGLTAERLWQKLAERIGQENVDRIRGAIDRLTGIWNFVRDVQERGVAAVWEYIQSQISGLWDMVLEQARNWIMERIINRAIQWLLSLLDPTGIMPVINSFIAFFRAVQSAIEYLRDILAIINDYVSTLAAIARGALAAGAEKLEQGLANAIPIAIGFLANQFGLGNIGEKIGEIVAGIRGLVDRALDWLLDQAIRLGQSLLQAFAGGNVTEETEADVTNMTPDQRKEAAKNEVEGVLTRGITGEELHTLLQRVKERFALADVSVNVSNPEQPQIQYFASNPATTTLTQAASATPAAAAAAAASRLTYTGNQNVKTPFGAVKEKYGSEVNSGVFAVQQEVWPRPGAAQATIVGPRPGGSRTSVIGTSGKVGKDEHLLAKGALQSYDGGHLIGLQLAGEDTNAAENLAPQIGSFNRGTYLQIENLVKNSPVNAAGHDPQVPIDLTVTVAYPGSPHTVSHTDLKTIGAIAPTAADQGSVTVPRRVPNHWTMQIAVRNQGYVLSSTTPSASTLMESQARGTAPAASTFIQPGDRFVWFRVSAAPSATATTIGGTQQETIVAEQETP